MRDKLCDSWCHLLIERTSEFRPTVFGSFVLQLSSFHIPTFCCVPMFYKTAFRTEPERRNWTIGCAACTHIIFFFDQSSMAPSPSPCVAACLSRKYSTPRHEQRTGRLFLTRTGRDTGYTVHPTSGRRQLPGPTSQRDTLLHIACVKRAGLPPRLLSAATATAMWTQRQELVKAFAYSTYPRSSAAHWPQGPAVHVSIQEKSTPTLPEFQSLAALAESSADCMRSRRTRVDDLTSFCDHFAVRTELRISTKHGYDLWKLGRVIVWSRPVCSAVVGLVQTQNIHAQLYATQHVNILRANNTMSSWPFFKEPHVAFYFA
jgi:hypothetical protein